MTDKFEQIMEQIQRRSQRPIRGWPYRHGMLGYNLHYWSKHPLRLLSQTLDVARNGWERARYGYGHRDVWSLDSYLARIISGGTKKLAETTYVHPTFMEKDEWIQTLKEISEDFADYDPWERIPDMERLGKYFPHLWD